LVLIASSTIGDPPALTPALAPHDEVLTLADPPLSLLLLPRLEDEPPGGGLVLDELLLPPRGSAENTASKAAKRQKPGGSLGRVDEIVDGISVVPLRAEDRLREPIVTGRLQPNERLIESDLARSLGVSRTLIRTALAPGTGRARRARATPRRARAPGRAQRGRRNPRGSLSTRRTGRAVCGPAGDGDIDELEQIVEEMRRRREADDLLGVSEENARLHRRLIEIGGHATASRLIASLNTQIVRFQYRTILLPGRGERSLGEHVAIIEAVAAGDPEAAMRAHLSHVAEALRQAHPA
jgi:DNA-binding GntR family transcriptional regulator